MIHNHCVSHPGTGGSGSAEIRDCVRHTSNLRFNLYSAPARAVARDDFANACGKRLHHRDTERSHRVLFTECTSQCLLKYLRYQLNADNVHSALLQILFPDLSDLQRFTLTHHFCRHGGLSCTPMPQDQNTNGNAFRI